MSLTFFLCGIFNLLKKRGKTFKRLSILLQMKRLYYMNKPLFYEKHKELPQSVDVAQAI